MGAGHLHVFDQGDAGRAAKLHVKERDNRLPEVRALVDAPLVQGGVVVELHTVALVDETAELVHARGVDASGGRLPEDVGHKLPLLVPTLRVGMPDWTLCVRFGARSAPVCVPTQSVGTIITGLLGQPTTIDVPRRAAHLGTGFTAQKQHQLAQLRRRHKLQRRLFLCQ